jgi:hypothetical protein
MRALNLTKPKDITEAVRKAISLGIEQGKQGGFVLNSAELMFALNVTTYIDSSARLLKNAYTVGRELAEL